MNYLYYNQEAIRVPKLEDDEELDEENYMTLWK